MFIINSADLCAITPGNALIKYADDATLAVPASNSSTISKKLASIDQWCHINNQNFNVNKSAELIILPSRVKQSSSPLFPPPHPSLPRVSHLTLLGVELDERLSFKQHINNSISKASQTLYALKTLKHHGLPLPSLSVTCKLTLLPRLTYESPCWWGSIDVDSRLRLQGVANRASRWGLCDQTLDINSICCRSDTTLFQVVSSNPHHVLYPLLPSLKTHPHDLRQRPHNFTIPIRDRFTKFNFIRRMLFP